MRRLRELYESILDNIDDRIEDRRMRREQDPYYSRIGALVCKVLGHKERVQGAWPEDRVCPRCGNTEIEIDFTVELVNGDAQG